LKNTKTNITKKDLVNTRRIFTMIVSEKLSELRCLVRNKLNAIRSIKVEKLGLKERLVPAIVVSSTREILKNTLNFGVPFFYPTGRKSIELIYERNNEYHKLKELENCSLECDELGNGTNFGFPQDEFLNIEIFENKATYYIIRGSDEIRSGELFIELDSLSGKNNLGQISQMINSFFNH
jgi:hypothetical protein